MFLASCHSQFAGEIFIEAGAKHAICIMNDKNIDEQACHEFTKKFYSSILGGNSVCSSFEHALKCASSRPLNASGNTSYNLNECNKFILLPKKC